MKNQVNQSGWSESGHLSTAWLPPCDLRWQLLSQMRLSCRLQGVCRGQERLGWAEKMHSVMVMLIDGCYNMACRHTQSPFYSTSASTLLKYSSLDFQPFRWNPDSLLLFWLCEEQCIFLSIDREKKGLWRGKIAISNGCDYVIIATRVYLQLTNYNYRDHLVSGWKKHPRSNSLSSDSTCILSNFCDC